MKIYPTIVLAGCLVMGMGFLPTAHSQEPASAKALYQITTGVYTMIGGIWGGISSKLPNQEQAFIALTTDPQQARAEMVILGEDQETVFMTLTNGIISGDLIRFQYQTKHPYPLVEELGTVDYTVTNTGGRLVIGGTTLFPPICCDIPYEFSHSNVVAWPLPVVSLRVSEVEISWSSRPDQNYQVQYQSELTTNQWVNLGAPVAGTGARIKVTDKVVEGQPRRFYRVRLGS